ncbi:cation-transporting P-type ATPase [Chloroflexota bacterium]
MTQEEARRRLAEFGSNELVKG